MLFTAALCLGHPGAAFAHDPGLSSLAVQIEASRIMVTLFLDPADAQALVGTPGGTLAALARGAIELRLDGVRLPGTVETRAIDARTGAQLVLLFDRAAGHGLTIRSDIPARLAVGHRQLLTVRGANGRPLAERMLDARERECHVDLRAAEETMDTARRFLMLGVRHILSGHDHLLFLGALLLGVRRLADVARTVTAFTVAHSLTLALAVLGFVRAPAMIVEPLIAASIVYVGLENLLRRQLDARWKLTFVFGLVHGFGFAAALRELGIAAHGSGVAVPLGAFNLGVEAGQIAVALALWPLVQWLHARPGLHARLAPACSMLVAAAGTYWLAVRTLF